METDEDCFVAKDKSYIVSTVVVGCLTPIIFPPLFRLRTDNEVLIWSIVGILMCWALIELALTIFRRANDCIVKRIVFGKSRISLRPVLSSKNRTKHIELVTIKKISVERSLRHPSRRTMYIETDEREYSIRLLNLDRSPDDVLNCLCANLEKLGLSVVEKTPAKWRVWKAWEIAKTETFQAGSVASDFRAS